MSRTNNNREYLLGATSGGYVYPNGTDAADTPQLTTETIFQDMQNAGISWKIYVDPVGTGCTAPYTAACLMTRSYLQNFTYAQTVISQYPQNIHQHPARRGLHGVPDHRVDEQLVLEQLGAVLDV